MKIIISYIVATHHVKLKPNTTVALFPDWLRFYVFKVVINKISWFVNDRTNLDHQKISKCQIKLDSLNGLTLCQSLSWSIFSVLSFFESILFYLHVCCRSVPASADWCHPVAGPACHRLVFTLLSLRLRVNGEGCMTKGWQWCWYCTIEVDGNKCFVW